MIWSTKTSNRSWNMASRKIIAHPKILGGVGDQDGHATNTSLLGKLIWQIMHSPKKYWVWILST